LKERYEQTPVVILTTSTDENDLRDCLKVFSSETSQPI
jgi:DNA-binding NarL/FixJ family response regulator